MQEEHDGTVLGTGLAIEHVDAIDGGGAVMHGDRYRASLIKLSHFSSPSC